MKSHYRTIIVSDVHLGTRNSKVRQLIRFLKHTPCDTLILNGDIIDGWQLRKHGKWKKKHTRFFKFIMKLLEKSATRIFYIRGNHDDFLDEILPFHFGNLSVIRDHIYYSGNKKYYITHGDIFDTITTNMKWLAMLGDIGYTLLLYINRRYNDYRSKKGLPYYSLSKIVKKKVKQAVSFVDQFEKQLAQMARIKNCDGIICGHIHQPANKIIHNVHYLNSGDWVESLSALCETHANEWEIVYYEDWVNEHEKTVDYANYFENAPSPYQEKLKVAYA